MITRLQTIFRIACLESGMQEKLGAIKSTTNSMTPYFRLQVKCESRYNKAAKRHACSIA